MKYRADVDGLRAIAVLWVILFHFWPETFQGGFVGVDVFFVISGFLITTILTNEFKKPASLVFHILNFYERRIKRIFPSLILCFLLVLGLGQFVLLDSELGLLGNHVVWASGFLANFRLWSEAGYFDVSAETKPLLHLWSLAVEEQFYILWPFFIYGVCKLNSVKMRVLSVLGLVTISFLVNIFFTNKAMVDSAFFLPWGRFWELGLGGLLSLIINSNVGLFKKNSQVYNFIAAMGFFMIVASMIIISFPKHDPNIRFKFPGYIALLPTLGAFLLIWTQNSSFNLKVLSHPLLVWIGKRSYPLYLFHWPLLVFGRIIFNDEPAMVFKISAIVLSFWMSHLAFERVENVIRHANHSPLQPLKISPKAWVWALVGCMIIICGLGVRMQSSEGFFRNRIVGKFAAQTQADDSRYGEDCLGHDRSEFTWCMGSKTKLAPRVLVIGDSHAHSLFGGTQPADQWAFMGISGCTPYYLSTLYPAECKMMQKIIGSALKMESVKWVVFVNASRSLKFRGLTDPRRESVEIIFSKMIESLIANGKKVILVVDNPKFPGIPEICAGARPLEALLDWKAPRKDCSLKRIRHIGEVSAMKGFYSLVKNRVKNSEQNLVIYDPIEIFCDELNCPLERNGEILYRYTDHVSRPAAEKMVQDIKKLMVN